MESESKKQLDVVTLGIIHNHLVNICREMGIAMMKTSYSTMFNEGLDFSCVIFNRKGEMIAQAEFCRLSLVPSSSWSVGRSRNLVSSTLSLAM